MCYARTFADGVERLAFLAITCDKRLDRSVRFTTHLHTLGLLFGTKFTKAYVNSSPERCVGAERTIQMSDEEEKRYVSCNDIQALYLCPA
jgi:hypothetical protein